ncbi:hypothetical protein C8F01DRAFT_1257470 [Mycena amicta]|nr:hypothetical protein C8F01DRAFT_1257470 [Mycena amicta]
MSTPSPLSAHTSRLSRDNLAQTTPKTPNLNTSESLRVSPSVVRFACSKTFSSDHSSTSPSSNTCEAQNSSPASPSVDHNPLSPSPRVLFPRLIKQPIHTTPVAKPPQVELAASDGVETPHCYDIQDPSSPTPPDFLTPVALPVERFLVSPSGSQDDGPQDASSAYASSPPGALFTVATSPKQTGALADFETDPFGGVIIKEDDNKAVDGGDEPANPNAAHPSRTVPGVTRTHSNLEDGERGGQGVHSGLETVESPAKKVRLGSVRVEEKATEPNEGKSRGSVTVEEEVGTVVDATKTARARASKFHTKKLAPSV